MTIDGEGGEDDDVERMVVPVRARLLLSSALTSPGA